jgi:regulatory protein
MTRSRLDDCGSKGAGEQTAGGQRAAPSTAAGGAASGDAALRERMREQALRLLEVRGRSRFELRGRLLAKGHPAAAVDALLERLGASGLLDDARFARDRARAMLRRKGWGPRKLAADLARRGVEREQVDAAIAEAYADAGTDPAAIMRREVVKRFGPDILDPDTAAKTRARARRFLLGRGFTPEAVAELLDPGDW